MGDAALDAFGDELGEAVAADLRLGEVDAVVEVAGEVVLALEVAFAGALGHGAQRAHAAVGLEAAALVEDRLAGGLVDAGKERPHHADVGPRGDGLGDVAGELDAAVGDDRDVALAAGAGGLGDGGDLGHAGTGDHARGADGAGADADLDGVRAGVHEGERAVIGGDVAGEEIDVREALFALADGFEHA